MLKHDSLRASPAPRRARQRAYLRHSGRNGPWPAVLALLLACFQLPAQPFLPSDAGTTVNGFQDDFTSAALDVNWVVSGAGVFSVSNGILHVATASGDPNHLLYALPGYDDTVQEVLARIRITSFGSGDGTRGGVGVGVDASSSQGINYLFRNMNSEGQTGAHLAFLDDLRAWGPGQNFAWQPNTWYWVRLRQEPNAASQGGVNDVFGRAWLGDGSVPEPSAWQLAWDYTPGRSTRTGYAGVTAGSLGGLAEFNVDYILIKAAGLPRILVAPMAFVQVPVSIATQPQGQTVMELSPAAFTVGALGTAPTYQWYENGAAVPGAAGASYTIPSTPYADNGALFTVVVQNVVSNVTYAVTSSVASLTVIADTNPPVLLGAQALGLGQVRLTFSERLNPATATNAANYLAAGANGPLLLASATLDASQTNVLLDVGAMTDGAAYTVTVNNLADQSAAGNLIAPNSQAQFVASAYAIYAIGTPSPAGGQQPVPGGMDLWGNGFDLGSAADQCSFAYQLRRGDFDVAVRVAGLALSDVWAKAGLMAREGLDPGSRFAATIATPAMVGSFFEWRAAPQGAATSGGSLPGNFPNTWLRLKRSGNAFAGFASYDGQTWTQLASASITMAGQVYLGLVVSSHNAGAASLAQFRDLAEVASSLLGTVASPYEPPGPCSRRTPLAISEIMYSPAARSDGKDLAYIELYNSNPCWEDVSGCQLTGDIFFQFPAGTVLPGGGFLVVAAAPADLQAVYGLTNVVGPYIAALRKSGLVQLLSERGAILLEVPYSNTLPWPAGADGTGHSIVLARPSYGEGDWRAWALSDAPGGSPGAPEAYRPSPLRNVLINEFLAHPADGQSAYVELYNHSLKAVDLSGCVLTDDASTPKFVLPANSAIPAGGYLALVSAQLGFAPNPAGGLLLFRAPDGAVLDAVSYEPQGLGISFGRWPDGSSDFYPLAAPTPGAPNGAIRIGEIVINEIMYRPISGNDDDQYVELYNQGTNVVDLAGWSFTAGAKSALTFPPNTPIGPDSYLVLARNRTNLFAHYSQLNATNTVGDFAKKLPHTGGRLALARPEDLVQTNSTGLVMTNTILVVEDEVTYDIGGRWGQWAHGGGSSLELIHPQTNHRLASNWADSDETWKSAWTNLEFTGVLDNGYGYQGKPVDLVQVGLLDVGECLIDNIEVRPGGPTGTNYVVNGDFEAGLSGWTCQGDHVRSGLEPSSGLGGYQSPNSLHLRSSDGMWTGANGVQSFLSAATLKGGQTATLRLQGRWLKGSPEVLLRVHGNWIELTGALPVPANLGSPGLRNSRFTASPGPAIFQVQHSPPVPAAGQPVVVTARFHGRSALTPTLHYRLDPATTYTSVPMNDGGANGDAIAGDGLYSATIPGQSAGAVVAFVVRLKTPPA